MIAAALTFSCQKAELENNLGTIAKSGSLAFKNENEKAEDVMNENYKIFSNEIYNYGYQNTDTGAIDRAYSGGDISEKEYKALKKAWNDSIDLTASTFYSEDGTRVLTKAEARKKLVEIIESDWCSAETKASLEAVYNTFYTPIVNGSNHNGSVKELEQTGNNFKVAASVKIVISHFSPPQMYGRESRGPYVRGYRLRAGTRRVRSRT